MEVLKRAFIDRDSTVVEQYFGANYKQHNPVIPDGPSAIAEMIPTLMRSAASAIETRSVTSSWSAMAPAPISLAAASPRSKLRDPTSTVTPFATVPSRSEVRLLD